MSLSSNSAARQLIFPNGLLVIAGLLANAFLPAFPPLLLQPIQIGCAALLFAAALLAVRLRSLRVFLALLSLGAYLGVMALAAVAPAVTGFLIALLAIDFAVLLLVDDAFFDWQAVLWWAALLFVQWSIFIAAVRWDAAMFSSVAANRIMLPFVSFGIIELIFVSAIVALVGKFIYMPDSVGAGLLWALIALAPELRGAPMAVICVALSGTVLALASVERSHWIAYHDELTGLPGRRAFNEALAALGNHYSIAMVDVDHFKKFNDTFGHDTGDHVLRKVAAHLARVGGRGVAFRCGGEEFAIVFADRELDDSFDHAEEVRLNIEGHGFIARGPARSHRERPDRRTGRDRRPQAMAVETSVTVSIGIAEGAAHFIPQEVVEAADVALYRAKHLGRNRVERAIVEPARPRRRRSPMSTEEPLIR